LSEIRKVVITGMAVGSPAGYTLDENYSAWNEGRNLFSEISRFNTTGSSVKFAGECPKPDVKQLPNRKVQKILRRKDIISLLTSLDAFKNAGLETGSYDPERTGMYCGASSTQIGDLTPYFPLVAECADLETGEFDSERFGKELLNIVNPLVVLQTLMNNGLCYGTMTLDIRGVNSNFMDFQVAGLRAVGEAFKAIQCDRADIVLAGGISGPVEPFQLAEGIRAGYLARTSQFEEAQSDWVRPYDSSRQGAILSEGSAYLVLEEEQSAIKRGANIHARVEGYSLANDGVFEFMREADSPGLVRSMDQAVQDANISKQDIGMVIGHGNGAPFGDKAEAKSYLDYFDTLASSIPTTSPKAILGDMCEAGGVMAAILAVDSIKRKTIPPTFNFKNGDEFSSKLSIRAEEQKIVSSRAMVTTRNFAGLSGTLIINEP
jgi:3-oxoacyl-[acyl-carrier-protein] synthase II